MAAIQSPLNTSLYSFPFRCFGADEFRLDQVEIDRFFTKKLPDLVVQLTAEVKSIHLSDVDLENPSSEVRSALQDVVNKLNVLYKEKKNLQNRYKAELLRPLDLGLLALTSETPPSYDSHLPPIRSNFSESTEEINKRFKLGFQPFLDVIQVEEQLLTYNVQMALLKKSCQSERLIFKKKPRRTHRMLTRSMKQPEMKKRRKKFLDPRQIYLHQLKKQPEIWAKIKLAGTPYSVLNTIDMILFSPQSRGVRNSDDWKKLFRGK